VYHGKEVVVILRSEYQNQYVSTAVYGGQKPIFYINVTGNVKNVSNHFEMNFQICALSF
jgi:hypothetical protein